MNRVYGICAAIVLAAASCVGCQQAFAECGIASTYSSGTQTANGELYNHMGISAAHKTLPFGTRVIVRNQRTGRSITVRINDRGPFVGGRVIDLSTGAKDALGMGGLAPVCLEVVSYGSGKKRGYEKPGPGGQLLNALNTLGRDIAKGTVLRSARGSSGRTRHASVPTRQANAAIRQASAHTQRASAHTRQASAATRQAGAATRQASAHTQRASAHTRQASVATHRKHHAKASHARKRYASGKHRGHGARGANDWKRYASYYE